MTGDFDFLLVLIIVCILWKWSFPPLDLQYGLGCDLTPKAIILFLVVFSKWHEENFLVVLHEYQFL